MNTINELHQQAMDLAEIAFVARLRGNLNEADASSRQAYQLEFKAAELIANNIEAEPTRSVFHRSAASLAIDCGEFRDAERLIAIALSGNPPHEIAEELRDLLEQVHFERHLGLRGVSLDAEEVQLSIAGSAVGYGIALSDEFVDRVQTAQRLIYRTVERLTDKPYRESGGTSKSFKDFSLFVSIPRASSFAVTLRIGRPNQPALPGFDDAAKVIDEILSCFELLNNRQIDELKHKIPDEAYYRNFLGLARKIAPDGDAVNMVGFTTVRGDAQRTVALTRLQNTISMIPRGEPGRKPRQSVTVNGKLRFADSISQREQIKLVDEQGNPHTIIVPEGMMNDIVKPLWDDDVRVTGIRKGKKILLEDIHRATN